MSASVVLSVHDLQACFRTPAGVATVVDGVSFELRRGETLALVGESGSGKTVTALAILGLLPPESAFVGGGTILYGEHDLLRLPERALRGLRGRRIAMIFQEPVAALNPVLAVGDLLGQLVRHHRGVSKEAARTIACELLRRVGVEDAERRLGSYPHELSGGTRQRVCIAMALSGEPEVLIADEPTTALDAPLQAQILDLLATLRNDLGMAVLWITHQLALVEQHADRLAVMRAGKIVEHGPVRAVFAAPRHPYTAELLARTVHGRRRVDASPRDAGPVVLEVRALRVEHGVRGGFFRWRGATRTAVDGVDLVLRRARTLALVGESGSGKTTLGLALLQLVRPTSGAVLLHDRDLAKLTDRALMPHRQKLQMVFQDPTSSLDPRSPTGSSVAEGMIAHGLHVGAERRAERVRTLLALVGLSPDLSTRYPHELSGGQRQRVAIARCLAVEPEIIVLDEPTSALDLSAQAHIIQLLDDLQETLGLAYLFITHDLALAAQVADEIAVMRHGRIVEQGSVADALDRPNDPYTRTLFGAAARAP